MDAQVFFAAVARLLQKQQLQQAQEAREVEERQHQLEEEDMPSKHNWCNFQALPQMQGFHTPLQGSCMSSHPVCNCWRG